MAKFEPGRSGNPGGRPKGTSTLRRYAAAQTRSGRTLVDQAVAVLKGEETNPVIVAGQVEELPPSLKDKAEARMYLTKVLRIPVSEQGDADGEQGKADEPDLDKLRSVCAPPDVDEGGKLLPMKKDKETT
jgi:hypothetical protein